MIGLIGWLLASLAAGAIGALATRHARDFHAGLVRPRRSPPGWLSGPVWMALYLMMGVAAWLVWRANPDQLSPRWAGCQ
jgi:benzodiazapine receptor